MSGFWSYRSLKIHAVISSTVEIGGPRLRGDCRVSTMVSIFFFCFSFGEDVLGYFGWFYSNGTVRRSLI